MKNFSGQIEFKKRVMLVGKIIKKLPPTYSSATYNITTDVGDPTAYEIEEYGGDWDGTYTVTPEELKKHWDNGLIKIVPVNNTF